VILHEGSPDGWSDRFGGGLPTRSRKSEWDWCWCMPPSDNDTSGSITGCTRLRKTLVDYWASAAEDKQFELIDFVIRDLEHQYGSDATFQSNPSGARGLGRLNVRSTTGAEGRRCADRRGEVPPGHLRHQVLHRA
jgi:hypothetical protein